MDARTVVDVEGWESRPFDGGYDGLHALADQGFTGCVVDGESYLFMVSGRVVGVFDYTEPTGGEPSVEPIDIERFEDATGTAYEAPEPALALLYAMAATGGETRGRYYSKNTALEEVDRTLRDGGFTGYLELSENVLSGDYYLVYHGGRRRSAAFVGQSRRLKGDDEAFDLAADEVGIYEVTAVSLSTVEIPGGPGGSDTAVVPGAGPDPTAGDDSTNTHGESDTAEDTTPTHGTDGEAREPGEEGPGESVPSGGPESDGSGDSTVEADPGESSGRGAPEIDLDAAMNYRRSERDRADGPDEPEDGDGTDRTSADGSDANETDTGDDPLDGDDGTTDSIGPGAAGTIDLGDLTGSGADESADADGVDEGTADPPGAGADDDPSPESAVSVVDEDATVGPTDEADGELEEPEETVDDPDEADETDETDEPDRPDETAEESDEATGEADGPSGSPDSQAEATPEDVAAATAAADAELDEGTGEPEVPDRAGDVRVVPSVDPARTERASPREGGEAENGSFIDGETVAGLRSELSARESRIEELRDRLESVAAERDEIASERDALARRISELEDRLAESGAAPLDSRELSPAEALAETSILVRYRSKTAPTLAEAHDGETDREGLAENLLLEPHTTFDTEDVAVSGRTFDAFLERSQGVGFLRWLVGELPFELRDTGNVGSMEGLYDSLPSLDRVEFDATVTLEGDDRETARFDLVGRDRRGNPLFVALLEDARAPTNEAIMTEFLQDATAAAESHESLVTAFAVTASYFEPEALETAEEATGGSLLSRSKRKSFVKTSRKGGYHLCLVEDREESFYMSMPEL